MQPDALSTTRFSFTRALRLLRHTLEVLTLAASMTVVLSGALTSPITNLFIVIAFRISLLSVLVLIVVQICSLFRDRRSALFGLARTVLYLFIIAAIAVAHLA
ncbi:MAG: hypothetical protein M3N48_10070 [Verrucomicrobiota bacterium]|nr:hypothetical protein [Verrucomicrobiota bacterium]